MPNQTVNKVEFGGQTVMDITDTTADAADVIEGEVFYTKSGARSVGTLSDATQSTHGLMSTTDKTKLDGLNLQSNVTYYNNASATEEFDNRMFPIKQDHQGNLSVVVPYPEYDVGNGLIKLFSIDGMTEVRDLNMVKYTYYTKASNTIQLNLINSTKLESSAQDTTEVANRVYGIRLDASNRLAVNVPWTDTIYSNATTSVAGLMSATDKSKLDGFNLKADTKWHNSATTTGEYDNRIFPVLKDKDNNLCVTVPYDTYAVGKGFIEVSTTSVKGRSYDPMDGSGMQYYTYTTKGTTTFKLNLINETNFTNAAQDTTEDANRLYGIRLDANDQLAVNVPWTDTTYSNATTQTAGLMSSTDKTKLDGIVDLIYPVGSIYMSVNQTSPETLFGGTWQALENKFLIGAGTDYTAGGTGGAASQSYTPAGTVGSHTLTTDEIPSHSHTLNKHTHSVGAHSHGLNSHKHSVGAHAHGLNSHTHSVGAHAHGLNSHTHGLNSHTHGVGTYSIVSNGAHTHTLHGGSCKLVNYGDVLTIFNYNGSNSGMYAESAGSHSHSITGSSGAASGNTAAATGSTANSTAFNSGEPSTTNTANSTAFDTGAATGSTADSTAFNSGEPSNNSTSSVGASGGHNHGFTGTAATIDTLPPYLVVYMWKRTA